MIDLMMTEDNYLSERLFSGMQIDNDYVAVDYFDGKIYVLRFNFIEENSERHSELEKKINNKEEALR